MTTITAPPFAERKLYRVYFRYLKDGANGPEYFWKYYGFTPSDAEQRAYKNRVGIEVLEVVLD